MASVRYPLSRQKILQWIIESNMPSGIEFYIIGVNDVYEYDPLHENVADVTSLAITAPEHLLENLTFVGGYLDADDVLFEGLDDTDEIHAAIVYMKWGGGDLLVAYLDETDDGSLPQPIDSTKGLVVFNAAGILRF